MRAKGSYFKVDCREDNPTIYLYDIVGDEYGGVTDRMFAEALSELRDAKAIDMRVNSPGGNAFQGHTIFNLLRQHPAHKRAFVDGIAASIASEIILACDEIEIAENGRVMIHQARGGIFGTADDLRSYANLVASVNEDIVETYASRGGASADDFRAMLAKGDTYFTAKEAVEIKLADRIGVKRSVAACLTPEIIDRLQLRDVPAELIAKADELIENEPVLSFEDALRRQISSFKTRS